MKEKTKCLFCSIPKERIIAENQLAFAICDGFPVTDFHTLVIPKRHAIDYFDLTKEELLACNSLLHSLKDDILKLDDTIEGFNLGMNSGAVAGQTIFHSHIHFIPRRQGDVENPRGGVRFVIPEKANY